MAMSPYTNAGSTRVTPQSEAIPGRESEMGKNNAGGVVFTLDCWKRLDRFLILGTEGGTYYVRERKHTKQSLDAVRACIKEDGVRTVKRIVEVSFTGKAPKNDPAIFALMLAMKTGDDATRAAAVEALPKVCRIGTHLFHAAEAVKHLGGWGRGTRRAFASWYNKHPDKLAYQLLKYKQRDGWSHRDILRKCHAKPDEHGLLRYAVTGQVGEAEVFNQIKASMELFNTDSEDVAVRLIRDHRLTREMVPTQLLNSKKVWEALLQDMPVGALVRNLGKMTSIGLIKPLDPTLATVMQKLRDPESIKRSRIHPMNILVAMKVYAKGRGVKGSLTWSPSQHVLSALDDAFYLAFDNVETTGKRILIGLDVSGSMTVGISGMPLSCREASAALSMVTVCTEPNHLVLGFTSGQGAWNTSGRSRGGDMFGGYSYRRGSVMPLAIHPKMRLDDVINGVARLPFSGTDCSLPMQFAQAHDLEVDTFIVYTDNETWAGNIHPAQALAEYRRHSGIDSKLVVVGMTASGFSIADPKDPGMLDVVGFDTSVPNVISEFSKA